MTGAVGRNANRPAVGGETLLPRPGTFEPMARPGLSSLTRRLGRPRGVPVRFGVTAVDQCVSSLSNFAVGVAVARVAGVVGFGAYSLAYSVWLLLAALHRSMITDLMAIENDVHQSDAREHLRIGLAAELSLGVAAALLFAGIGAVLFMVGQHTFGVCFLALAPWLPCLLAQDYWRWVGFMRSEPGRALANDIVFDVIQAVAFVSLFAIGVRSSLVAIGAWGVGGAGGALYGLWQFSIRPSLQGGVGRMRERWHLGKWLVAVNAAGSAQSQSTLVLTGGLLGPAGLGGLKAATSLVSGPSLVLIQAGGSLGLPEASKALHQRGWPGLRRVQRIIAAAGMVSVGLISVAVFLFGRQLLTLLYGPSFARFAAIADILALAVFVMTIPLGAILSLKATRQTREILPASLGSLIVSIIAVVILAPLFGVVGAAEATVIGNAARSAWLLMSHWQYSRPAAERMGPREARLVNSATPGPDEGFGDPALGGDLSIPIAQSLRSSWTYSIPPGWGQSASTTPHHQVATSASTERPVE